MKKILIFLILIKLLFSSEVFVGAQAPLLDEDNGKQIAKLHIGAKLKVINTKDKYVQVEYTGFTVQDSTISYARLGVLEQDLEVANIGIMQEIEKIKDDYDNEWIKVSVKGYVKQDALVNDINKIYANGEELFKNRCGGCHALHGYDEFSANVWPSVIESMIPNSALEPNEFEEIVRFLQNKAPVE